ncbi:ribonuclease D [Deinococcus xinjiangensis]|uniref:Ribonuclease D n=1 Tax=Deinococcus xinjiangensis TaxID=457454 RepID=A0ABP9V7J9_9DEIO
MTQSRSLRPDARLVQLHAERSDPALRLADALANLEDADWGMLFAGEVALARQLAALLGAGTLRVDGRINLSRSAFAEAGLAVADLHGDLKGARAAVLFDPDERTLERAKRSGVKIIVDSTLSPGGGWPMRGADYVLYRDGVTLTGYADAPLAALFGVGAAPEAAAPAPSDLSVALALRDVATLPLRLARAARTVGHLNERLGGAARPAGPTALLLAPDAAPDTLNLLGGVMAATQHVPDGVLLTPGLEDTEQVLKLLRPDNTDAPTPASPNQEERREDGQRDSGHFTRRDRDDRRGRFERRDERRTDDRRSERQRPVRFEPRPDPSRPSIARPDQPKPDQARPNQARPERLNTERSAQGRLEQAQSTKAQAQEAAEPQRFTFEAPASTEETWEPEIVFSDIVQSPAPLTHTVSNGPDAPDQRGVLPDVLSPDVLSADMLSAAEGQPDDSGDAAAVVQPTAATLEAAKLVEEAPIEATIIAPDLPTTPDKVGKEDPTSNLTDEQAAIYARLRDWRNAEAKRQEISRFIIASNATLAEIARRIPYTEADLKAVKGMGPERMKKYGEKILEVVKG